MSDIVIDIVGRRTLDQLLESAARGRENEAFIILADDRTVTFGAFLAQRREAERLLRAQGIGGDAALTPDSPATIIFASGTTSEPKSVVFRHGHQIFGAEVYASRLALLRGALLMHHFPLFHMNGLNQLTAAVVSGARVLLLE